MIWQGHITAHDVVAFTVTVTPLLVGARAIVADARGVTGFDTAARDSTVQLFALYRDSGIDQAVSITSSALVRIAASTVALICRLPVRFVETPEQAERLLLPRDTATRGAA